MQSLTLDYSYYLIEKRKAGEKTLLYHEYLLLKILLNSNSLLGIDQIVAQLETTKRTAYSVINGVNVWLETHGLDPLMVVRTHGYYIQPAEIKKVKSWLSWDLENGKIKLPPPARIAVIEFTLLCKKNPVTLQYLNDLNGVTTRTTRSDLAQVKAEIEKRNLTLSLHEHGYQITGLEEESRKFAVQKLANIQDTIVYDKIAGYLDLDTKDKLQIEQMLLSLEQNSGCYLTDESIFQVKEYICFAITRYRQGHYLTPIGQTQRQLADESSETSTAVRSLLSHLGVSDQHLQAESQLLLKIIDSRQISKTSKKISSQKISQIATEIIRNFSVISGIDLVNSSNLQKALTTHLIAAKRRVEDNVQFLNSSLINVKSKYPEIYFLTKKAVYPFEQYLNQSLTTDEIELIAIYFGGEIELRNHLADQEARKKVVLVCGSGVGTSRLLKIQLAQLFPKQLQISVVTKQDYEELASLNADVVIATLPVTSKGPPIININRILTDYDLQTIKQSLLAQPIDSATLHNSPAVKTTQVLDIVSEFAQVKDFPGLTTALQSYFAKRGKPVKKKQPFLPSLSELLPSNRIVFTTKRCTWPEAVELAGKLLQRDQVIDGQYVTKMRQQINRYGPYMRIMDDVMLLHAKPDQPCKYSRPGMSLVCFKYPVDFGQQVKAKYVFSLYAPAGQSHLKALTQLTEIFSKQKLLEQFRNSRTAAELDRLFSTVMKGDEKVSDAANNAGASSTEC